MLSIAPRSAFTTAALALLSCLLAGVAGAKQWTVVRIAMDATYPPFESLGPNGQITGFDKDIADALCAEMKVTCEFTNQAWEGIIPGLLANKYDAILSSMSITEERKKQIAFSNKYYNSSAAIVVPSDSTLKGTSAEDLKGAAIGAQTSTQHAAYVEAKFPGSVLKIYPSPDQYKLDLASKRIDAAIDDIIVLDAWVKSNGGSCCKILGAVPPDEAIQGPGAGIGIRKEDTDLQALFNKAIVTLRANGVYKSINAKYFDFDIFGD